MFRTSTRRPLDVEKSHGGHFDFMRRRGGSLRSSYDEMHLASTRCPLDIEKSCGCRFDNMRRRDESLMSSYDEMCSGHRLDIRLMSKSRTVVILTPCAAMVNLLGVHTTRCVQDID